jgi:LPXTG-motif cell wall-anchored protein
MSDQANKRLNSAEKVILFTGILLIILSFISEFNFHFIQGFMPDLVNEDIFWRAEAAEVFNSMSFLILGLVLIIIAFILSKKRKKI